MSASLKKLWNEYGIGGILLSIIVLYVLYLLYKYFISKGKSGNEKMSSNMYGDFDTILFHKYTDADKAIQVLEKKGFNVKHSADGSIWMTSHPDIGEVAASGKGGIVKRYIDKKKMKLAGWNESDKYGVDELINKGYHGVEYTKANDQGHTHYQIFHPEMLKKD